MSQSLARLAVLRFLPLIKTLNRLTEEFDAAARSGLGLNEVMRFTTKYFNLTEAEAASGLAAVNRELESYDRKLASPGARDQYIRRRLEERKSALEREKKALQEIQRLRRVEEVGNVYSNEGRSALPGAPPLPGKGGAPRKEEITDAQRALDSYVESLSKAIAKTEEMSEVEQALVLLRDLGTTGQIPQVRQLSVKKIDIIKVDKQRIILFLSFI